MKPLSSSSSPSSFLRKSLAYIALWLRSKVLPVLTAPHVYFDYAWDGARKYIFSIVFIALVLSKVLHIYSHAYFLTLHSFLVWVSTFFVQEAALILVSRFLTRSFEWRTFRFLAALIMVPFSVYVASLTSANGSFYVVMGREIHWGATIGFYGDMIPGKHVLFIIVGIGILYVSIVTASYFVTPYLYQATGAFVRIWSSSLSALFSCCCRRKKQSLPDPAAYEQIALDEHEDNRDRSDTESVLFANPPQDPIEKRRSALMKRFVIIFASSVVILLRCFRPPNLAYYVLSSTLANAPFAGPTHHPVFEGIESLPGDFSWLGDRTALDTPRRFDWLPPDEPLAGFEDWYPFTLNEKNERIPKEFPPVHYNPAKDPLHIPNRQNDVLEPLREALHSGAAKVKHVIIVKLESNRQDVFPLRADSKIMERVKDSFKPNGVPKDVQERLSRLTPTAERLTGSDTGFNRSGIDRPAPYGGMYSRDTHTTGSFTLKSVTGTMCGLNPLAAAMNREWLYHIYQPCLPQIFETLNRLGNAVSESDDWTFWPWHTTWMQSVSGDYDYQDRLMPVLGFQDMITQEWIDANRGEHSPDPSENVPGRGYMDKALRNILRDAVVGAERSHTRLFLSHLTGSTHRPWSVPGVAYEDFFGDLGNLLHTDLNCFLNTLKYQDEWLAIILEILQEEGVADETLLVMVGDHGVSLPNDHAYTPNANTHESTEHVPLVVAHPKLPPIEIDGTVLSSQILPTILDILIESSSLNENSTRIMKDLLPMYGGQSLIRPLISDQDKKQEWFVTTTNQGGDWISLRSSMKPYRLVVPLIMDAKWRFSDVAADPLEDHPVTDFEVMSLVNAVQGRHGNEAVAWLVEAVHVSRWWISENHRRWGYDPNAPKEP